MPNGAEATGVLTVTSPTIANATVIEARVREWRVALYLATVVEVGVEPHSPVPSRHQIHLFTIDTVRQLTMATAPRKHHRVGVQPHQPTQH